jgi:hypothetical protein
MATKPKFRCVRCGEYNQVGEAKPYKGPENRKYRREWKKELERERDSVGQAQVQAQLAAAQLAALHSEQSSQARQALPEQGHSARRRSPAKILAFGAASVLTRSQPSERTAAAPTLTAASAGWLADPTGHHELRYWDGTVWTEHVSSAGIMSIDRVEQAGDSTARASSVDGTQNGEGRAAASKDTIADQLSHLAGLYRDGLLSENEFAAAKSQALGEVQA